MTIQLHIQVNFLIVVYFLKDYILDENHTHLLLTSVDKCDEDLRTSLEKFISQQIVDPDDKESCK